MFVVLLRFKGISSATNQIQLNWIGCVYSSGNKKIERKKMKRSEALSTSLVGVIGEIRLLDGGYRSGSR